MQRKYLSPPRIHGRSRTTYKTICFTLCICLLRLAALAQSGEDGIDAATAEVQEYFDNGTDLMYAIGAIVGLVGAVKVYNKWNSGDNDTGKVAAAWFGSCIFLIVVATVLKGFFVP